MEYEVKITNQATAQIYEIISYISHVLLEPETAKRWSSLLQEKISELNTMPSRFPLILDEPWRTKGIRKMVIKNFIVYFFIKESDSTVWITAVLYGKRDQLSALRDLII